MKVNAYRRMFDFLNVFNGEQYLLFLRKHLLDGNPNYYAIISKKKIDTSDGVMYALRIGLDITDPNFEPIAECWINGQLLYLWRNYCWTIAVDSKGELLAYDDSKIRINRSNILDYRKERIGKILILHHISNEKL